MFLGALELLFSLAVASQKCNLDNDRPYEAVSELVCAIAKTPIQEFFNQRPPCLSLPLLDYQYKYSLCDIKLGMMTDEKLKTISTDRLDQFAKEIVLPTKFSKIYHGSNTHPELKKELQDLSAYLKSKGIKYFNCEDMLNAVSDRYKNALAKKEVGMCYPIQTLGGYSYIFESVSRTVPISFEQQKKIENLFIEKNRKPFHLDDFQTEIISNEQLTIDDLKELLAIRKASELFEKATPLRNDEAGTKTLSNLKGEFLGGDQLTCDLEASTHKAFLDSLSQQGLLKNFEVIGQIHRKQEMNLTFSKDIALTGHTAVLLRSRSTGREVVYDSWFEKGGDAAHILFPDDWHELKLHFKNQFRDIVPILKNGE